MDDILVKRKEAFFNNLVLLGLDKVNFERKHGITFHKDMFVLPNKKGYEVITHFLFLKLSAATGKDYNIPWPLLSKDHDRQFQKTCYGHLMNFSQENVVKFPRIVPSLLSTFGGDRFYDVYLAFSCYVVSKTISKNGNVNLLSRPTVTRENFVAAKHNLQLSTMLHLRKFRDAESMALNSHHISIKFAKNLQIYLQKLKQLLKTYEELLRKNQKVISSLYSSAPGENLNLKQIIERSFECWKPMLKQRKTLEAFFSSEKKFWNHLASEVGKNVENEFLNGQDYNICIPDNLPEECRQEIEKVGFSSSHIDGKLSVHRFMKLLMAYVMYIAELLKKNDMSDLDKTYFVENATSIQDDLCSIENLNKKLGEELVPEVEGSIEKLKLMHNFDDPKEDIQLSCNQFCDPLPVISFNPHAVKERASHFNASLGKMFEPLSFGRKLYSEESNDCISLAGKDSSADLSYMNSICSITGNESVFLNDEDIARTETNLKLSPSNDEEISLKLSTSNEEEISLKTIDANVFKVPCNDLLPTSSKLTISDLDDIDFTPSTQFKMRGSWLNEESLYAMTLPDISFDE